MEESQGDVKTAEQAESSRAEHLKPWQFKPGQSGNPLGLAKGTVSLKTWAKKYIQDLTDEQKLEFIGGLDKLDIWKMSEGNPDTKNDNTVTLTMSEVIKAAQNAKRHKPTAGQKLEIADPLFDKGQGEQPDNIPAQQSPNTLQPAPLVEKFDTQEPTAGI